MGAAVVGAVVGASVSAGVLVATDDDATTPASSVPVVRTALAGEGTSVEQVLAVVEPATVVVSSQGFAAGPFGRAVETGGAGTGMVLQADGLIVTNAHVVAGADRIQVRFADGSVHDAAVVGTDTPSDVAVIQADSVDGAATVDLATTDLRVGQTVIAIGNALDLEGGPTVTRGIISALDRSIETSDATLRGLVQTDAAINPGNSGGPLVDAAGRVVGMNTAVAGAAQNIGFAIPADGIRSAVADIQAGDADPAPGPVSGDTYLGVAVTDAPGGSARVGAAEPGSPAADAGLVAGDVILEVDGAAVADGAALVRAIRRLEADDVVTLSVRRGGVTRAIRVELGSRDDGDR